MHTVGDERCLGMDKWGADSSLGEAFQVEKGGGTSPSLRRACLGECECTVVQHPPTPHPLPSQSWGIAISVFQWLLIARINCIHFVMPADIHITWAQFTSPVVFPWRVCSSAGGGGGGGGGLSAQ